MSSPVPCSTGSLSKGKFYVRAVRADNGWVAEYGHEHEYEKTKMVVAKTAEELMELMLGLMRRAENGETP